MDFLQVIIGHYFLGLIGAFIRFSFGFLCSIYTGKNYFTFAQYWNSKKGDSYDKLEREAANEIVGIIFFGLLIVLIYIS